jgi:ADP-heptose:LPS heptosyltransferase
MAQLNFAYFLSEIMLKNTSIQTTGVFRALQLGDLLCSIPAVRAFKTAYPDTRITLIGMPWASTFASRFDHYFSDFIAFPGYPGLPEQKFNVPAFEEFTAKVKSMEFDLLLQMQGNGTVVNSLLKTLGARQIAGFDPCQDSVDENVSLLKYPDQIHEIDRHLALMSFLGISSAGTDLEFPISEKDREEFAAMDLPVEAGRYVCIHPGSRGVWRQWPPLYFAAIGDYLHSLGYKVVLTGTADEMQLIKQVGSLLKNPPVIAAGKTTLGSLAVLIAQSAAIICNCTGVSHMASALKVPAVVISMDGEPARWCPKDQERQRCVDWTRNQDYQIVFKEVAALFFRL